MIGAIAKKILVTQAMSASSEIIFSRDRRIGTADQNRLDPFIVGSLLCVSENLKWHAKMSADESYHEVANEIVPLTNCNENEEQKHILNSDNENSNS